MPIFFVLNGLGLVFLVYVMVNFWKEGRRGRRTRRTHAASGNRSRNIEAFTLTQPISQIAQGAIAVMPLRGPAPETAEKSKPRLGQHQVVEMPVKGMSTNSAAKDLPHRARIAAKEGPRC